MDREYPELSLSRAELLNRAPFVYCCYSSPVAMTTAALVVLTAFVLPPPSVASSLLLLPPLSPSPSLPFSPSLPLPFPTPPPPFPTPPPPFPSLPLSLPPSLPLSLSPSLSLPPSLPPQVILFSNDVSFVSECVLVILSLLYPLQYLFPAIPLLPTSMPSAENVRTKKNIFARL